MFSKEELMREEWRPIPGHEDYMISNLGRIMGKGGWLLRSALRSYGGRKYIHVILDGKTERVHRLVALAYLENDDPERKREVHHKNHITTDNRAVNLEWCDRSYNLRNRRPYKVRRRA